MKRVSYMYMSNFGSKGQSSTFRRLSGCTYFLTEYRNTSWSVFFLFCTQIQNDERKMPRKFQDNLTLIKVSKGRCPKALDDSANFSVLCQVGGLRYAFCYQFRIIFCCFGTLPLDRTGFFTLIIPRSRDIVQVVQTVQNDLQNFRFTEQGTNYPFVLKTSHTIFTRCKNSMKSHFIK